MNLTNAVTRKNEDTGCLEILVDRRSQLILFDLLEQAKEHKGKLVGFDIETDDRNRHAGLNAFMSIDPKSDKFKRSKKLVFDINRTTIDGFSLYFDGDEHCYYFNLNHADQENCLSFHEIQPLLSTLKENCTWVIHNFSFEQTMTMKCWEFDLGHNYIDTLQLAVSAYNDDEYDPNKLAAASLQAMAPLFPAIAQHFGDVEDLKNLTSEQQDIVSKFAGKNSDAAHSYNGMVKSITYGYGLKKAVKSFFGYEQTSFEEALKGYAHMGHLMGEEILHYGADDAYWCVKLFHALTQFIMSTNPSLMKVFFKQENPMPYIWSECWRRGWRVNHQAIKDRELVERKGYVDELRELAALINKIQVSEEPNPRMLAKQKWYKGKTGENFKIYRNKINFLVDNIDEAQTDFEVARLVSGPISTKWVAEQKEKFPKKEWDLRGNFDHYMVQRTLLHDLCDLPFHYSKGEISTDAESRGALLLKAQKMTDPEEWLKEAVKYEYEFESEAERQQWAKDKASAFDAETVGKIIQSLSYLSFIGTRVKLYINPYMMLTDPETGRMYPVISGLLNTRRLAAKDPNTMQLAKKGDSTYVRGFFLPENDDHVLVAVDWSQVELVLIGENSKDPKFFEAYGQIPYNDLHVGAAVSAIQVKHPEFTLKDIQSMRHLHEDELDQFKLKFPNALMNPIKNTPMEPSSAYKFWRNEAGKTSNFGYWYSGSLMTVQSKLNWTMDEMWAGTENYRRSFPVAEEWRLNTIREAQAKGAVDIFDGHRRTRFEATHNWLAIMTNKFNSMRNQALSNFGQICFSRIQRRAGNQVVNAKIQGGCATLAKRSILRLYNIIKEEGWDAHFIVPIHDELVFSVHKDQVIEFSERIKKVMCDHIDLVSWLKLDGTISVGLTLEPYDAIKAPYGQIELDEAPILEGYIPEELEGTKLNLKDRQKVVNYLFETRMKEAA